MRFPEFTKLDVALSLGGCNKFQCKNMPGQNVPSSRSERREIIDRKNGANVKLYKADFIKS